MTNTADGTLTINSGSSFDIEALTRVNGSGGADFEKIINNGTLKVVDDLGELSNASGGVIDNHGMLFNDHIVTNGLGGVLNNYQDILNYTTFNNIFGGTINNYSGSNFSNYNNLYNHGTIVNDSKLYNIGTLINQWSGAIIENNGTIYNYGTFDDKGGVLTGNGQFLINALEIDEGTFRPEAGFTVKTDFSLTNSGTLEFLNPSDTALLTVTGDVTISGGTINFGDLSTLSDGLFTLIDGAQGLSIDSTILNNAIAVVDSFDTATYDFELLQQGNDLLLDIDQIPVDGNLTVAAGETNLITKSTIIQNSASADLKTITNYGEVKVVADTGEIRNFSGGIINNYELFTNNNYVANVLGGIVNNYKYFNNNDDFVNLNGGTINNEGSVNGGSGFNNFDTFTNHGVFNNNGLLYNRGAIYNHGPLVSGSAVGVINNYGTISNYATFDDKGGILTGNGVFKGNALEIDEGIFRPETGFTIETDFSLTNSGTLEFLSPGSSPLLTVTGSASLSGGSLNFGDLSTLTTGNYTLIDVAGSNSLSINSSLLTTAIGTVDGFDTATQDFELMQQGNDLVLSVNANPTTYVFNTPSSSQTISDFNATGDDILQINVAQFYNQSRVVGFDYTYSGNTLSLTIANQEFATLENINSTDVANVLKQIQFTGTTDTTGSNRVDILIGNASDDWVKAWQGDDYIYGGDGADQLFGARGEDVLLGGNGADILRGKKDNDILLGGHGGDSFVFDNASDGGTDRILDFNHAEGDRILLNQSVLGISSVTQDVSFNATTGELSVAGHANPIAVLENQIGFTVTNSVELI
ncbi:MAG: calcium-binding protein [Leptolyngbya sp. SIO3F4]|nr:calcium-binding protein [Leptolyngbya sp. SIO3F4]